MHFALRLRDGRVLATADEVLAQPTRERRRQDERRMTFEQNLERLEQIARQPRARRPRRSSRRSTLFEEGIGKLRAASAELAKAEGTRGERSSRRPTGVFEVADDGG